MQPIRRGKPGEGKKERAAQPRAEEPLPAGVSRSRSAKEAGGFFSLPPGCAAECSKRQPQSERGQDRTGQDALCSPPRPAR